MFSLSLAIPMLFTMLIHAADSLSYALRLGGLRTRRIALALSLSGILLLVSRTSNMAQGPMVGNLVDTATSGGNSHFAVQLHWLMGAATAGTAIAILCFPTMVKLASRMVVHFEAAGSIPVMVAERHQNQKRSLLYYAAFLEDG
jgi:hypothetical protein